MGPSQSELRPAQNPVDRVIEALPDVPLDRAQWALRQARGDVNHAVEILLLFRGRRLSDVADSRSEVNQAHRVPTRTTRSWFCPPVKLRTFIEQPSTVLHLVNYPAQKYFETLSHCRNEYLPNQEYVLADCRLQFTELLTLDGCIEVEFVSMADEDDKFFAHPIQSSGSSRRSWHCDQFGWMDVPVMCEEEKFQMEGSWWSGLKYSLDVKIRSLLQFQLFAKRALRLFVIPVETEQYARIVICTNTPVILTELDSNPQGGCGQLLAHQLMAQPAGDWVGTMEEKYQGHVTAHSSLLSTKLPCHIDIPKDKSQESSKSKPPLSCWYTQHVSGQPLPVALRQSYTAAGIKAVNSTHLFPHQKETVKWMLSIENGKCEQLRVPQAAQFYSWYAYSHGMEKTILPGGVDVLEPREIARGGLIAHPVGSGKTVIAIELIRLSAQVCQFGMTLVCVPGHISKQWHQEVQRFAPSILCQVITDPSRKIVFKKDVRVVIMSYEFFESPLTTDFICSLQWKRVIFDEPQDILKKDYFDQFSYGFMCQNRWLLTATPNPMQDMIQLALGYKPDSRLPLESIHHWFVRTRCRRDPPAMCLPVPPLHIHMLPVTLTWQETSVVYMHAMQNHLQASIQLCSYFANVNIRGNIRDMSRDRMESRPQPELHGAQQFDSLNDWIIHHRRELEAELISVRTNLFHISKQVSHQSSEFQKQLDSMLLVSALPVASHGTNDHLDEKVKCDKQDEMDIELAARYEHLDEKAMEIMFDEYNGVDPELALRFKETTRETERLERLLRFLETVTDTISSDTECTICMELLCQSAVAMLPCLHAFCAICMIGLFGSQNTAVCPVCRNATDRRQLCIFKYTKDEEEDNKAVSSEVSNDPGSEKFCGSKIFTLAREITNVLKKFPTDKILIFAQWEGLLKQISKALPVEKHILLGSMQERCHILDSFRTQKSPRVLLLSLDQHASGANLDIANHVFIVHPHCPAGLASSSVVPLAQAQAYEQQAVGRVLRFPQSKEVHLYRLYARGTVEEELYMHWGWA
jgi:hypothetical protein